MSIYRFLRGKWRRWQARREHRRVLREPVSRDELQSRLDDWKRSLAEPTAYYVDCHRWFHRFLPKELQDHRAYFTANRRGFGEDAFHTMWWLIANRFPMQSFLEIGVYRGQTLSLASLLQEGRSSGVIVGISPFTSAGDSVSKYLQTVDYHDDTLQNFRQFNLPPPTLVRAFSTDPASVEAIRAREWDCIYIDGNHDYEVAKADWTVCAEQTRQGGLVVLDDSALGTSYQPPSFATAGHPGPSQVAREIEPRDFREVLRVGHNRVFQRV